MTEAGARSRGEILLDDVTNTSTKEPVPNKLQFYFKKEFYSSWDDTWKKRY